tara:strand:+ start:453 stop:881 length:429 start_codon:yes stop_codon:yes gene_type:complete
MKLTKSQLKQIIKEELSIILTEAVEPGPRVMSRADLGLDPFEPTTAQTVIPQVVPQEAAQKARAMAVMNQMLDEGSDAGYPARLFQGLLSLVTSQGGKRKQAGADFIRSFVPKIKDPALQATLKKYFKALEVAHPDWLTKQE